MVKTERKNSLSLSFLDLSLSLSLNPKLGGDKEENGGKAPTKASMEEKAP